MYWGYLHSNGSRILKRWHGDEKDYTADCYNNPFVIHVVRPFPALSTESAAEYLDKMLTKQERD